MNLIATAPRAGSASPVQVTAAEYTAIGIPQDRSNARGAALRMHVMQQLQHRAAASSLMLSMLGMKLILSTAVMRLIAINCTVKYTYRIELLRRRCDSHQRPAAEPIVGGNRQRIIPSESRRRRLPTVVRGDFGVGPVPDQQRGQVRCVLEVGVSSIFLCGDYSRPGSGPAARPPPPRRRGPL